MQTPLTEKEGYGLVLLKTTRLIEEKCRNDRSHRLSLWIIQRYVF